MKKHKKSNSRKCVLTNSIKDKSLMIRIVKTKSGKYFVDSKEKGRGAYISKGSSIEEALRKRVLNRAFKTNVPKEVYKELEEKLKGE